MLSNLITHHNIFFKQGQVLIHAKLSPNMEMCQLNLYPYDKKSSLNYDKG